MSVKSPATGAWVKTLPDGAVSVDSHDGKLVLRASAELQEMLERLLNLKKAGRLDGEDERQYEAICELDDALSGLNRELRHLSS